VSSFIASRFRDELLFFTMNHPANVLLGFVAHQVTELLGITGGIDHRRMPDELLGSTFYPIHASHVRALRLGFGGAFGAGHSPFRLNWVTYEPAQVVEAFFDYYAKHPGLVELNVASHT
jgi:hypothetical protein